jgi:hypothetical protein
MNPVGAGLRARPGVGCNRRRRDNMDLRGVFQPSNNFSSTASRGDGGAKPSRFWGGWQRVGSAPNRS